VRAPKNCPDPRGQGRLSLGGCRPELAAGLTGKLMGWEDIISIMDANEKDALAQKRAAMLDQLPYSN
jgi:predicted protein tyrosine phosphatase